MCTFRSAVLQLFVVALLVLQPSASALAGPTVLPHSQQEPVPTNTPPVQDESGVETLPDSVDALSAPLNPGDEVWIVPAAGGGLLSSDQRVGVNVPPRALTRRALLRYTATPYMPAPPPLLKFMFELALTDEAGQRVEMLDRPAQLRARYLTADFPVGSTETPTLLWFDALTQAWRLATGQLNTTNETITTEIMQPGMFALTGGEPQGRLSGMVSPSLLGAAPTLWTGDSTFTYPLDTPTGYGGSHLALALSYSSGAANANLEEATNARRGQASDFGLGWSLQGGAITRDNDGRFYLEFPGGSYQLRRKEATNYWETEPPSFLQIIHQPETTADIGVGHYRGSCPDGMYLGKVYLRDIDTLPWIVRTPDGTTYRFGADVASGHKLQADQLGATATYWMSPGWAPFNGSLCVSEGEGQSQTAFRRPHHWYLTRIEPSAGEAWNFHYAADLEEIKKKGFANLCEAIHKNASNSEARYYVRHSRLERIVSDLDLHQIEFVYFVPGDHRSDQPEGFYWGGPEGEGYDCNAQWQVSDHLASHIIVRSRAFTTQPWDDSMIQRVYALEPSYGSGYDHAQLKRIVLRTTETQPLDPGPRLPTTFFTYTTGIDDCGICEVLQRVDNGYGGSVELTPLRKTCGNEATGGKNVMTCAAGGPGNGRIVVDTRKVTDGMPGGQPVYTSYDYSGSVYAKIDDRWQFWGFATAFERLYQAGGTANLVRETQARYFQGPAELKGQLYEETVRGVDATGALISLQRTWYDWDVLPAPKFPRLWRVTEYLNEQH